MGQQVALRDVLDNIVRRTDTYFKGSNLPGTQVLRNKHWIYLSVALKLSPNRLELFCVIKFAK